MPRSLDEIQGPDPNMAWCGSNLPYLGLKCQYLIPLIWVLKGLVASGFLHPCPESPCVEGLYMTQQCQMTSLDMAFILKA